jgi:hypothetical protein
MTINLFISDNLSELIYDNVVNKTFPKLINDEKKMLHNYLVNILNVIAITFNYDMNKKDKYVEQFTQNNYKDCVALLLLLLPYISGDTKMIKSLEDLYVEKESKGETNVNDSCPKYIFSNLQYGRCLRESEIKEIKYSQEHVYHNYLLLLSTIQSMSHRLYFNWIDVVSYDLATYKESQLYIDTQAKYTNNKILEWNIYETPTINDKNLNLLKGLTIEEMYDTISLQFFENIFDVKWLIYDIISYDGMYPLLLVINNLFKLNNSNDENYLETFSNNWETFVKNIDEHNNYENIPYKIMKRLTTSLMYAFDSKYGKFIQSNGENSYKSFNKNEEEINDDDDDINKTRIDFSKILYSMKTVKSNDMYAFLEKSIGKLKTTWFSKYLFTNGKETSEGKIISFEDWKNTDINKKILALKNVYNYAKSFVHVTENGEFIRLPQFWKSLNSKQKDIIVNRFNNKTNDWFNIPRYVGYIKQTKDRSIIYSTMSKIYDNVRSSLIEFIFESLIMRGSLTKFEPFPEISNEKYITNIATRSKEVAKKSYNKFKDTKIFTDAYHYLTGTTFKNMKNNYFDFNKVEGWYDAYAMNWVSQINFFHKYLNNRIMFVTGSTGVGKSTQIPKLLLYALKAIDHKYNGKIACTQPRTAPTENNADRISDELGTPIKNDEYYVQYKHKKEKHIKYTPNDLTLQIMTDGSLIQELKDPLLKIGTKNKYDIVIVDESHEHNKNMDLILTIMKQVANYNNSIKLVIISATMDDDEPTYRRYYRDINDNRMYPLNVSLKENKIDRINVDRRLHISPPNQTTRFNIEEHFLPNKDPIILVKELYTKSYSERSDTLLFYSGSAEIKKSVKLLNTILPPNIIALPFYSELDTDQKKIVEKIAKRLKDIKFPRDMDFDQVNEENISKGGYTYNQCVIVATNIAEASITINTLKFVIDTGKNKTAIYDCKKGTTKLVESLISESSRLQRKGRVGRVGSGTVYYLYDKSDTENIKKNYDISISDIHLDLCNLLCDQKTDKLCFTEKNNPNNPKNNLKNIISEINYSDVFSIQYFLNNQFYDYYGNDEHYDYQNYEKMPDLYIGTETIKRVEEDNYQSTTNILGFSYNVLCDFYSTFYIVHPNEIDLIRNINGQTILTSSTEVSVDNGKIMSNKINCYWQKMIDSFYISLFNDVVTKTKYGKLFANLNAQISEIMSKNFLVALLCCMSFENNIKELEYLTRFFSVFSAVNGDFITYGISTQIVNNKPRKDIKKFQKMYDNKKSDVGVFLYFGEIMNNLMKNKVDFESYDVINKNEEHWGRKMAQYGLCEDFLKRYVKNYSKFVDFIQTNKKKLTECANLFKNIRNNDAISDKFIVSLVHGFRENVCKNIGGNVYLPVNSLDINSIVTIKETGTNQYKTLNITTLQQPHGYVIYFSQMERDDVTNVTTLMQISEKNLIHVTCGYSKKMIHKNYVNSKKNIMNEKIMKDYPIIRSKCLETIDTVFRDLINNYDVHIWNRLAKIVQDYDYLKKKQSDDANYLI